jgi:murein DD-endopeptidase MepM/ murein hydrolase activator NlpD
MGRKFKLRWGRQAGYLVWSILGLAAVLAGGWLVFSRLDFEDPWIALKTPVQVLGAKTTVDLEAGDKSSGLKEVRVTLTQDGQEKVVLERALPPGGLPGETVELKAVIEPKALGFNEGRASLSATVRDRSWRNWFKGRSQTLTQEVTIDLVPLTVAFQSMSHLLHCGGVGVISYRTNKAPAVSGLMLGDRLYKGFPNPKGGANEYVVLFPVPQEAQGPAAADLVARPAAGQEVKQRLSLNLRPRKWRHDNMNLSDDFLRKVAASFPVANPHDPLAAYLEVNREMRVKNHARVRQVCQDSQPGPLWAGAFFRYEGKPMARFGDRRSYIYQGKVVDQQIHLGEDLADKERTNVPAGNNGIVVMAEPMGIYGQSVVLDHGLGVFSMYSHLSQIDVQVGDKVNRGVSLGRTGVTGLAAGDHLHFSMMVQGDFVDPREWWDARWLKDQVELVWAGAAVPASAAQAAAPAKAKGKGKAAAKGAKSGKKKKR